MDTLTQTPAPGASSSSIQLHAQPLADYSTPEALGADLVASIRDNALDRAQALLERLNTEYPQTRDLLVFPVMIAIQRGRAHDAWQYVNGAGDEHAALKALCLRRLNDPAWHGYAQSACEHSDVHVRKAMRNLLGSQDADDLHESYR